MPTIPDFLPVALGGEPLLSYWMMNASVLLGLVVVFAPLALFGLAALADVLQRPARMPESVAPTFRLAA